MPLYNFATYADLREEWVIEAKNLETARDIIGDDPAGSWLDHAQRLDAEAVDCQSEFVTGIDGDTPAIEEITLEHWAWREAHRSYIEHSLKQNIAAISGDFCTHRLYGTFYDTIGKYSDGFVGSYELCIAMAEALTDWEVTNGPGNAYEFAGVSWIEVVEDFVESILETAIAVNAIPDPAEILPRIQVLAHVSDKPT